MFSQKAYGSLIYYTCKKATETNTERKSIISDVLPKPMVVRYTIHVKNAIIQKWHVSWHMPLTCHHIGTFEILIIRCKVAHDDDDFPIIIYT